jgi:hypothetical protein
MSIIEHYFYLLLLCGIMIVFSSSSDTECLISIIDDLWRVPIIMRLDSWPNAICVICKERQAEPMTFICEDQKCFQIFMDIQSKGKLMELLGISKEEE